MASIEQALDKLSKSRFRSSFRKAIQTQQRDTMFSRLSTLAPAAAVLALTNGTKCPRM